MSNRPKVICIEGVVGCGKSTLLENLYDMLSKEYRVHVIHEYIDTLLNAQEKLTAYLNGDITAYEFQRYILGYYASNTYLINEYDYILVERCPIMGLKFFGGLDVKNNRLSEYDFDELMDYAESMSFYPNPYEQRTKVVRIATDKMTPDDIAELAHDLIVDGLVDVLLLTAKPKTIKKRIRQRGRQCEIEAYTDDYIQYMVDNYAVH